MAKGKKQEGKNPEGRPTKYDPAFAKQAMKICLLGATDNEIADFFEVSVATINNWKKEYPEFLESIKEGKKNADLNVVTALYESAQDRIVKEQQAIKVRSVSLKDGKRVEDERVELVEVEKVIPADFRSQQFWLKNRQPDKWRDKQEIQHSIDPEVFEIGGQKISF